MSSSDIAISVRGISKSYTIAHNAQKHSTLAETMLHRFRNGLKLSKVEQFSALKDVSFDVHKGEVVGIIGRNGAGKSTLLKILSRITEPSAGKIDIYGRVGSLLEVGTGFHPELTGRENIYLNGAILGMRRREIQREFDAIVDFAEVEKFLDTPVKRYSSGMYVRLAFAVAAHLKPEILVVDEVLAVGDAEFQKKCLGKMQDVSQQEGRTILFVSHNMAAVASLCTNCILLKEGTNDFQGNVDAAVDRYLNQGRHTNGLTEEGLAACRASWARPIITAVRIHGVKFNNQTQFAIGEAVKIEVDYRSHDGSEIRKPVLGIVLCNALEVPVGAVNMRMTGSVRQVEHLDRGRITCALPAPNLAPGQYVVEVWLGDGMIELDMLRGCASFTVESSDYYGTGIPPFAHFGSMVLNAQWDLSQEGA